MTTDRKYPDYAQRLRDWICERLQGKCRIISEGDDCTCALCDFDRMWQAARAARAQPEPHSNAESITRNMVPGNFPMHAGGITGNDAAPAQPTRSQKLAAAGFTRRPTTLEIQLSGEDDAPAQDVTATEWNEMRDAMENCRLYAARHRKEEWARTILDFCKEAGATGSPLRAAPAQDDVAAADEMVELLLREAENCPGLPIGESESERDAWTDWATTVLKNLGMFQHYRKYGPLTGAAPAQPMFAHVYCSQCGCEFGPGDHGYSHCTDHD